MTDDNATRNALRRTGCTFESDVPLGPLTWYGVGGVAEAMAHPRDVGELSRLVAMCAESDIAIRVLGRGANLLVCEGVVAGVVVKLDQMRNVEIPDDGPTVRAAGGADLEKLITSTVRRGRAGLEVLGGIPASIGGAIRMNAGGAFGSIAPTVESVTLVEPTGRIACMNRDEIRFGYRRSSIGAGIVAEALFALEPGRDPAALRERLKEVMRYKKQSQPMAANSAGCAFKNPPSQISDKGAGRLIDEAGLKGFRLGGAEVSTLHANFIVLHPGGRATDALALMLHVQRTVRDRFGVTLQREVVVWD